jgi:ribosomal protein S18 acetylase RimI-like enzyme
MVTTKTVTESDIATVGVLAQEIWRGYYPGIITTEQIDYMLARMYAPEVIRDELAAGTVWELILRNNEAVGYLSYEYEAASIRVKLGKLYVLPALHGHGIGRQMLDHVKARAARLGGGHVYLTVNKQNTRALRAYHAAGFQIAEAVVTDIGGGFVMDDFVMRCDLPVL